MRVAAVAVLLCLAVPLRADSPAEAYLQLIARYRAGAYDEAAAELHDWPAGRAREAIAALQASGRLSAAVIALEMDAARVELARKEYSLQHLSLVSELLFRMTDRPEQRPLRRTASLLVAATLWEAFAGQHPMATQRGALRKAFDDHLVWAINTFPRDAELETIRGVAADLAAPAPIGLSTDASGALRTRLRAAEDHYRSAVRYDPSFGEAHFRLGRLLERTNHRPEAERCLLRARELTRDPVFTLSTAMLLGRIYQDTGRTQEALAEYEQVARLDPGSRAAAIAVIALSAEFESPARTRERIEALLASPESGDLWLRHQASLAAPGSFRRVAELRGELREQALR